MSVASVTAHQDVTSARVGTVWVVARHLLVAQALTAALQRRLPHVKVAAWDRERLSRAAVDRSRDLVLVTDELATLSALEEVGELLAGAPARTVVMTALPKGYAWGALLAAGASEVTA